jgi:hypothetical protein
MEEDETKKTDEPLAEGDVPASDSDKGVDPEVKQNNPDELLEEDRSEDGSARVEEPAGDNLSTQNPTQDQTSGEDDVGGSPDEAYDEASDDEIVQD